MYRVLVFLLLALSLSLPSPSRAQEEVQPNLWEAMLYMGPSRNPDAPWDLGAGQVVYTIPSAQPFAVRGEWPGTATFQILPSGTLLSMPLVVGDGVTQVNLPAGVAGQRVNVSIPWDPPVVAGPAPANFSKGGYFYDSSAKIAYTVTWPDFCGAAWPCPADDAVRLKWDVWPAAGLTSGWLLAEDSRGAYVDPSAVSWGWYANGASYKTGSGYTVVSRPEYAQTLSNALDARHPYMQTVAALLGPRPYSDFGYADIGSWAEGGSAGWVHHTPLTFIDVDDAIYTTVPDHEYALAWYGDHIGYPHIGELIVAEGVATYIEMIARDFLDGSGVSEVESWCLYLDLYASRALYPAWAPNAADASPADVLRYSLPSYAGAMQLVDISVNQLGDRAALATVLGDIAQDLPPGAYSWRDILAEIEARTGANVKPSMKWVVSPLTAARAGKACDVF